MIYIFLASIFYASAIMFGVVASRSMNTNLSATIVNVVSAILPITIVYPLLNAKTFQGSQKGIIYSLITGVFITLFTLALTKSYSVNKVGIVTPIVFGGAIFLTTTLSYFFYSEKVSKIQLYGLLFLALGFGLIIYARWAGR